MRIPAFLKSMLFTQIKYRPNVAGILRNPAGEILICERLGNPGAWQFPQGGVDGGESYEEALARELKEEIGIKKKDIQIDDRRGPYRYLFPNGRQKRGCHGNEQYYFLADFVGPVSRINLATKKPEFQAHRWIAPAEFSMLWLNPTKREIYREVFREFFGVAL